MKSFSFGGFEPGLIEVLTRLASESDIRITEPGIADIHIHKDPDFGKLSVDPGTVISLIAEPKVVRPDLYQPSTMKKYLECITISRVRAEKLGLRHVIELPINPPQKLALDVNRDRRICLVAGHKFSASKLSNYGLRRKILYSGYQGLIDLYGPDWFDPIWLELQRRLYAARLQLLNPKEISFKELLGDFGRTYSNYRGIMDANFSLMRRYELSLVIENQSDYVSEKIWISLARGAVPIYVGPSLLDINKDLASAVFQVEGKPETIWEVVNNASSAEIELKRSAGFNILESDWIVRRNEMNVAKNLLAYLRDSYA